jgi:hypothetical protein
LAEADIHPEHIVVGTAVVDTEIEHTEIVDTADIVDLAHTDPAVRNLAVHSVLLPMDYHIHHRSAYREYFVSHNLHTIRIQGLGQPEEQSVDYSHNWYKRQSTRRLLYYRSGRNEEWKA